MDWSMYFLFSVLMSSYFCGIAHDLKNIDGVLKWQRDADPEFLHWRVSVQVVHQPASLSDGDARPPELYPIILYFFFRQARPFCVMQVDGPTRLMQDLPAMRLADVLELANDV